MGTPLSPRAARTPVCTSHTQESHIENAKSVPEHERYLFRRPSDTGNLQSGEAGYDFPPHRTTLRCLNKARTKTAKGGPSNAVSDISSLMPKASVAAACAQLPNEGHLSLLSNNNAVVYHVLRNLDDPLELARAATVCRLWCDVAAAPSLWTASLEREHRAASAPSRTSRYAATANTRLSGRGTSDAATTAAAPEQFLAPPQLVLASAEPLQRSQQQQQMLPQALLPLLPKDLLQPPSDTLGVPVAQMARWMGIRRMHQQSCRASRLDGVRGSWAAYVPDTCRLVVLDQKEQRVAFVDLSDEGEEHHRYYRCSQRRPLEGEQCGGGGGRNGTATTAASTAAGSRSGSSSIAEIDKSSYTMCRYDDPATAVADRRPDDTSRSNNPGKSKRSSSSSGTGTGSRRSSCGNGCCYCIHFGPQDGVRCCVQPQQIQEEQLKLPEALRPPHGRPPAERSESGSGPPSLVPAVAHVSVPAPEPLSRSVGAVAHSTAGSDEVLVHHHHHQPEEDEQQAADAAGGGDNGGNDGGVPEELPEEERYKLQVVAACGGDLVATGHPDGRVLIWDSHLATPVYTLPAVEGCGRGAVMALAGDSGMLAVAYRKEVLVWELRCWGNGGEDNGGKYGGTATKQSSLIALIKPSLGTVVRSMALSRCHGVLAMRSWDGVELREVRGGRWLNGFPDRRNTALLAAGDVLFLASSSPSFMGNHFLQFDIEVTAIDLAAVVAAMEVAGDTPGSGRSGGDVEFPGAGGVAAAAPADGAVNEAAAGGGAGVGGGAVGAGAAGHGPVGGGGGGGVAVTQAGGGSGDGSGRRRVDFTPLVARTMVPPLRYTLRGPPLSEFRWDQPMQLCLTGGMLLLRCLQFKVGQGQLSWPGMFAFRLGDLLEGLALGRTGNGNTPAAHSAPEPPQLAAADGRAAAVDSERVQPQPGAVAVPPPPPPDEAEPPRLAPQPPKPAVVLCRAAQPEVLCGDGGFMEEWPLCSPGSSPGSSSPRGGVSRCASIASVQLLATKRHLVVLSESLDTWTMELPYCQRRQPQM